MIFLVVAMFGCQKKKNTVEKEPNNTDNTNNNDGNDNIADEEEPPVYTAGLNYIFNTETESYTLVGIGSYKGKEIIVPKEHNSKPVSTIGVNAFKNNTEIIKIVISSNINEIANYAFLGCNNLTDIKFESESILMSIGEKAFSRCENLPKIELPASINIIGKEAFSACYSLRNIELSSELISFGANVFEGTEWWESCADGIVYIGSIAYGYKGNSGEEELAFKVETKVIPDYAFSSLNFIKRIRLTKDVEIIGYAAFTNCKLLESIEVHSENTKYKSVNNSLVNIKAKTLILGCKNSHIPNTVEEISDYSFHGAVSLSAINIPETVKKIGEGVFKNCENLSIQIILPKSIKTISKELFSGCIRLPMITIEDSVTKIEASAFANCELLKTVYLDSEQISSAITGKTEQGGIIYNATTIYIRKGNIIGSFIIANYDKAEVSEFDNYDKYVINSL